ncbi:hypothetical protein HMPREF1546_00454 [Oscillibacter sp. KLE 1745]|nr:hypothetical protein HMPREF1546_00454 [Oscillibacter sp. KLE 1745]
MVKRVGGNPPGREGAGYNGPTRLSRGTFSEGAVWPLRFFLRISQKIPCFCRSCRIAAGIPQISLAESGHIQYNIKVRNFRFLANLAPEYLRGLKHT